MESSISLALATQLATRRRLEVVAHNIANASTTGFRVEGQVLGTMPRDGGDDTRLVYPIDRGSFTDQRPGAVARTGRDLDVAVDGSGFLAVEAAGGRRLTRDGRLTVGSDGTLRGAGGGVVASTGGGALIVPEAARRIEITPDGTVLADAVELGRLALFAIDGVRGLERSGDGLLSAEGAVLMPEGRVVQGSLERSNVQPVQELVDLIELQRGYERAERIIDGEDERIRKIVDRTVRG
jgi:flagellar basal-body rod protein FlgF